MGLHTALQQSPSGCAASKEWHSWQQQRACRPTKQTRLAVYGAATTQVLVPRSPTPPVPRLQPPTTLTQQLAPAERLAFNADIWNNDAKGSVFVFGEGRAATFLHGCQHLGCKMSPSELWFWALSSSTL